MGGAYPNLQMQSGCLEGTIREERTMKKFSLAMFAIALALVFTQAASAQFYDFSFTYDGNVIATGGLEVSGNIAVAGSVTLTSLAPQDANDTFNLVPFNAPGVTVHSPGVYISPSTNFWFDNWFNPAGPTGDYVDNIAGLLFVAGSGDELNIFTGYASQGEPGSPGAPDQFALWIPSSGYVPANGGYGIDGTIAVTGVPEGGSLLFMLALCGLGLAGGFLFKARNGLFMSR
jgi:hypothetical protein